MEHTVLDHADFLGGITAGGVEFHPQLVGVGRKERDVSVHERVLDEHEINLVAEGSISGTIAGKKIDAGRGSLLWYTPGNAHSFLYGKGLFYYFIRFTVKKGGTSCTIPEPFLIIGNALNLLHSMHSVILEQGGSGSFKKFRLNALLGLFISDIFTSVTEKRGRYSGVFSLQQKNAIEEFVHKNIGRSPRPRDCADVLRISYDYFSRIFFNTYGMSAREWIVRERINTAAMRIMESDIRVQDLADDLGYSDIYLFSRQFKQVIGVSPLRYRKEHMQ